MPHFVPAICSVQAGGLVQRRVDRRHRRKIQNTAPSEISPYINERVDDWKILWLHIQKKRLAAQQYDQFVDNTVAAEK